MYAFTAAHKTLPLPSFARVTNLDNGKSVVVRVNDRGPFHEGRVIDLSYAAAVKLGITQRGTGRVEVRALTSQGPGQRAGFDDASAGQDHHRHRHPHAHRHRQADGDGRTGRQAAAGRVHAGTGAERPPAVATASPAGQSCVTASIRDRGRSPVRTISTPGCASRACAWPPASRSRSKPALLTRSLRCRSCATAPVAPAATATVRTQALLRRRCAVAGRQFRQSRERGSRARSPQCGRYRPRQPQRRGQQRPHPVAPARARSRPGRGSGTRRPHRRSGFRPAASGSRIVTAICAEWRSACDSPREPAIRRADSLPSTPYNPIPSGPGLPGVRIK